MLEANKSAIFEQFFLIYNQNLLKRRFHSMQISGLDFLLNKSIELPLIIYCNHSSWWDGLVAFQISRKTGLDSYIMMEEKQLKRLFLFRLLGAFSVVREKPREALKSVNYAVNLLKSDNHKTLWLFPQGKILPNDIRPLIFFNGLAKIIGKVKACATISISMRYEFLGEFKPRIFVKIAQPQIMFVDRYFNAKSLTNDLCTKLTDNLNSLKTDVLNQNFSDYQTIF